MEKQIKQLFKQQKTRVQRTSGDACYIERIEFSWAISPGRSLYVIWDRDYDAVYDKVWKDSETIRIKHEYEINYQPFYSYSGHLELSNP